jgi:hypothetical protein
MRRKRSAQPLTISDSDKLTPKIDVWRAANLLIRRHGADAESRNGEARRPDA